MYIHIHINIILYKEKKQKSVMVNFKFWKKTIKKARDPITGQFLGSDLGSQGEIQASTRATSGVTRNVKALTDTMKEMNEFQRVLKQSALDDLADRNRYSELIGNAEESEDDSEDDMMKYALKLLLPQIMQRIGSPQGSTSHPEQAGAGWETTPQAPIQRESESVGKPAPLDTFNRILKQINMIPDKVLTEERVEEYAHSQGLDYPALQGVVSKLSKVMVK